MSPKALCIFKTRKNVRIKSEKSNRHENTNVWETSGTRSVFYINCFQPICETELTLSYMKGQSSCQRLKKSWKVETLQRWLCCTGSPGEVLSSVSRGQRISSRCGAVKSVLCPKRLVTVEGAPAIRGFLSGQPPGSQEHSHPAPPPAPVPAPCSSSLPLSCRRELVGKSRQTLAHWLPRPETQSLVGGGRLWQPLSRLQRWRKVSLAPRFPIPEQTPFLFLYLRPRPPPTKPDGHRAGPQSPKAGPGRGAGGEARREAQSPPLRPAPSVGLGPEGGSREGRWGPHPPAPPLSPPGITQEPPLPQRPLPRPSRRDPRRQSHRKKPRPPAGYLQTPSPRAAANCCRLLRMRDASREHAPKGHFCVGGVFRPLTLGFSRLEKGREK